MCCVYIIWMAVGAFKMSPGMNVMSCWIIAHFCNPLSLSPAIIHTDGGLCAALLLTLSSKVDTTAYFNIFLNEM